MRNPYYTGRQSDHFDGLRFFNTGQNATDRSLREIWRWRSTSKPAKWPTNIKITQAIPSPHVDHIRITMIGHVTMLIQTKGLNILTDPVWAERASPVPFAGPKRVTAPGIAFEDLPPIDVVLISHNHYDHMDLGTLQRLHKVHQPLMITPLGNDTIIRKSIPKAQIKTGDWGDHIQINATTKVILTRANHWSSRGVKDRRMALWSGFWIETENGNIWFAGDTGYGDGTIFRDIKEKYGVPDIALIPIGAYAPRWFMSDQHVDPAEAVKIFRDVGSPRSIGMHWGTFQLTDEARDAPKEELALALLKANIAAEQFVAAEAGNIFDFQDVR
jgi:L-ascorbate metabolism protein UlaG (beta-lactamase superfamily)